MSPRTKLNQRSQGHQGKVLFQGLHMTCVVFVLVYNFKFCILNTPFNMHLKYKYKIRLQIGFYIMYIMHSCPLSHKYKQFYIKGTLSKSIIFKIKSTFEPNVFKWVIKKKIISSSPFALLINLKILSNFQKEWCTFGRKKDVWKK